MIYLLGRARVRERARAFYDAHLWITREEGALWPRGYGLVSKYYSVDGRARGTILPFNLLVGWWKYCYWKARFGWVAPPSWADNRKAYFKGKEEGEAEGFTRGHNHAYEQLLEGIKSDLTGREVAAVTESEYEAGYEDGHSAGFDAGLKAGEETGDRAGYRRRAQEERFTASETADYRTGYTVGYDAGWKAHGGHVDVRESDPLAEDVDFDPGAGV